MSAFLIPLIPDFQTFSVTLAGTQYTMTVKWCAPSSCWVLNIANGDGDPILQGIPLVTGCDLLGQYAYLNFGGELRVQTSSDPEAVPTFTNLGKEGNLFFVIPEGVAA